MGSGRHFELHHDEGRGDAAQIGSDSRWSAWQHVHGRFPGVQDHLRGVLPRTAVSITYRDGSQGSRERDRDPGFPGVQPRCSRTAHKYVLSLSATFWRHRSSPELLERQRVGPHLSDYRFGASEEELAGKIDATYQAAWPLQDQTAIANATSSSRSRVSVSCQVFRQGTVSTAGLTVEDILATAKQFPIGVSGDKAFPYAGCASRLRWSEYLPTTGWSMPRGASGRSRRTWPRSGSRSSRSETISLTSSSTPRTSKTAIVAVRQ